MKPPGRPAPRRGFGVHYTKKPKRPYRPKMDRLWAFPVLGWQGTNRPKTGAQRAKRLPRPRIPRYYVSYIKFNRLTGGWSAFRARSAMLAPPPRLKR